MAGENIQVSYPNFCSGPINGEFTTLHGEDTLNMVNSVGAVNHTYTLSHNITNDLLCIEYAGPKGLTSVIDDIEYLTIEKVSSTSAQLKRWRIDGAVLRLQDTITKSTGGVNYFDSVAGCVEYYNTGFAGVTSSGTNSIVLSNYGSRLVSGARIHLGPSTVISNLGATEYVTVDYTVGNTVYLLSSVDNDYHADNEVAFYNYFYLYSSLGYDGSSDNGTLFKLNAYDGSIVDSDYAGHYKSVSKCKWFPYTQNIPSIIGTNALFVAPYNSYQIFKSMALNNVAPNKMDTYDVYDFVFSDSTMYQLMQQATRRDDDGVESLYNWVSSGKYNYIQNTAQPYVNNIAIYTDDGTIVGQYYETDFIVVVKDQFGVGLNAVDVLVGKTSGDQGGNDPAAEFEPLDGQITTNASGIAVIKYTSGAAHNAETKITCNCQGSSSTATGSTYVWDYLHIHNKMEYIHNDITDSTPAGLIWQHWDTVVSGVNGMFKVEVPTMVKQIEEIIDIEKSIFCKTFFTSPGGDWINPSSYSDEVGTYLPHVHVGDGDGPQDSFFGWLNAGSPGRNHTISQILNFSSEGNVVMFGEVKDLGHTTVSGAVSFDLLTLKQIVDEEFYLQISQPYSSKHKSDRVLDEKIIDQFLFIQTAIPAFWSEKNPVDTDIYIRLLPRAYDLDSASLKFYVREVSYAGDTGYVDMGAHLTITDFPAGIELIGLDVTCDPPSDFHYSSTVYVRIEVYDKAPTPNFLAIDYWFWVVPDYRIPYLLNLDPVREQDNVAVNSGIYFEIKDLGEGLDINSLEVTVNSRLVTPTNIEYVTDKHYKITYNPTENFQYNKSVLVNVNVVDSSPNKNRMNDSYRFYTTASEGTWFTGFEPRACARGVSRYASIRFFVLDSGTGIDRDSIRIQVLEKEATNKFNVVPIIYRIQGPYTAPPVSSNFFDGEGTALLLQPNEAQGTRTCEDETGITSTTTCYQNGPGSGPFGGSSIDINWYYDSRYFIVPHAEAHSFLDADFTVEFWYRPNNYLYGSDTLKKGVYNGLYAWHIYFKGSSVPNVDNSVSYTTDGSTTIVVHTGKLKDALGADINVGIWHHFAWCRSAEYMYVFCDGVMQAGSPFYCGTDSIYETTSAWNSRVPGGSANQGGDIDEIRFINGTGLYTSNFTRPTEAITYYG